MHAPSRGPARLVPLAAAAVTVLVAAAPAAAEPTRLPVYDVKSAGVGEAKAERLAAAFGLDANLRHDDGSLAFLDVQRFGFLPVRALPAPAADEEGGKVVAEAPDLDAIRRIVPLGDAEARRRATSGLARAGLPFEGEGRVSHSHFDSVDAAGRQTLSADVDTHVSFPARLGDLPLVGPGAKSKLVFDPGGRLTYLRYARRELSQAATVPLLSTTAADALATARFTAGCPGDKPITGLKLSRRLVYYAPALSARSVQRIVPHYDYGAQARSGAGRSSSSTCCCPPSRRTPRSATLARRRHGGRVTARTAVTGGRAPYTYRYGSCTTTLPDAAAGAGARDLLRRRGPAGRRGRRGRAAHGDRDRRRRPDGDRERARDRRHAGRATRRKRVVRVRAPAGAWTSDRRASATPRGCRTRREHRGLPRRDGGRLTIAFHWADNDVFESDFVDAAFGGDDATWGDNVDLMWFQGHGNADGFATGATQGDGLVDAPRRAGATTTSSGSSSTRATCSRSAAARAASGTAGSRHSGACTCCSATATQLQRRRRRQRVRRRPRGRRHEHPQRVGRRDEAEQPDGVIYRYMGVYGPSGEWNRNDYFHGIGSVSGDITTVTGAWSYSGTV